MTPVTSRVTRQHQTSIPAEVRRRFGIRAGTELVWEDVDGELRVRPVHCTIEEVRAALGPPPSGPRTLDELRAGKIAMAKGQAKRGRRR